jgi:hypothetical protein
MDSALDLELELARIANARVKDSWIETDVREEVLAPLVRLLGYSKSTEYDINREQPLLTHPFLMVGSEKVRLDYAFAIRRRSFWILEAKRPSVRLLPEAVHQAYFYAIHPEVQARFFAVCNGHDFALYDVRDVDEKYSPTLRFSIRQLRSHFPSLRDILGSDRVRDEVAQRALADLEATLTTEVREERLDSLEQSLRQLLSKARRMTEDNKHALYHRRTAEQEERIQNGVHDHTPVEIASSALSFYNTPRQFDLVFGVLRAKFRLLQGFFRERATRDIVALLSRDIPASHRVSIIQALLRLLPDMPVELATAVRTRIRAESVAILERYPADERRRAFWTLEALLRRLPYKLSFVDEQSTAVLREIVERKRHTLPDEDLAVDPPSVWNERYSAAHHKFLLMFNRFIDAPLPEVTEAISALETLESEIEPAFQEATRHGYDEYATPPNYAYFDKPLDSYRSFLFSMLLREIPESLYLIDTTFLDRISELLRAIREPDYIVHHGQALWLQGVCAHGGIDPPRDPATNTPISDKAFQAFMRRPMLVPVQLVPSGYQVLLTGALGDGRWLRCTALLEFGSRRVQFEDEVLTK